MRSGLRGKHALLATEIVGVVAVWEQVSWSIECPLHLWWLLAIVISDL
jgi:hypothetical protein